MKIYYFSALLCLSSLSSAMEIKDIAIIEKMSQEQFVAAFHIFGTSENLYPRERVRGIIYTII